MIRTNLGHEFDRSPGDAQILNERPVGRDARLVLPLGLNRGQPGNDAVRGHDVRQIQSLQGDLGNGVMLLGFGVVTGFGPGTRAAMD